MPGCGGDERGRPAQLPRRRVAAGVGRQCNRDPALLSRWRYRPWRNGGEVGSSTFPPWPPDKGVSAYGLTKNTVERMTAGMAHEVGDKGITVNCIAPGICAFEATIEQLPNADAIVASTR